MSAPTTPRSLPVFPNYVQMPRRVPPRVWYAARALTVLGLVAVVTVLVVRPRTGLALLWGVIVPTLPLVWLLAPGVWRNVCPLAASNQVPRLLGFTRGRAAPAWWSKYAYVVGMGLFLGLVAGRKWVFNASGRASAALLLTVLIAAFVGGYLLKGKSGWCSSICPLLPVQRLYGQTPFATVPNAHCQPCVGCTRNCYDFNPAVAQLADLSDDDPEYAGFRRFFAGVLPGLVVAFFTVPDVGTEMSAVAVNGRIAVALLISLGAYYALASFTRLTTVMLTALFGAAALNLFYWYAFPRFRDAVEVLTGLEVPAALDWPLRVGVAGVTLVWLARTAARERIFELQTSSLGPARIGAEGVLERHAAATVGKPELVFEPDGRRIVVDEPRSVLDIAEQNDLPIEPGCRMGFCGADPVAILAGMDNLSEIDGDERGTLERLGYAANTRMACMARVLGPVTVSLEPQEAAPTDDGGVADSYDPTVRSVVIVGNGIAGVTAADHIRRRHPDCEIHLVGREVHHLYNRMAISRVIYGRSAMHGLYLQPEDWYERKNVTCWLNTQASRIDRDQRVVALATGEELAYDRLILATGAHSWVPPLERFGLPGSFVLREAEDAAGIRRFVQEHRAGRAVVAGGGLLGLEAAYALLKLGLQVTVLELAPRLLPRQLDEAGSDLLRDYLATLGLEILTEASAAGVTGDQRLRSVRLSDGRTLPADVLLVAAGVRANLELARDAGIGVDRGILVDDEMRTSDPDVYAAGDAVEHEGQLYGLWPPAVEQARIAGTNAVSPEPHRLRYGGTTPVTMLKVVGVDLLSLGRLEPGPGEEEAIVLTDPQRQRYAKLVLDADARAVGAILLGYPEHAAGVTAAVRDHRDLGDLVPRLREGDWSSLDRVPVG